jgi:peptidoglycan/LPS O-acetylase OafA/YrhL
VTRVPELDGIRGIAIALVIVFHLQELLFLDLPSTISIKVASRILGLGWVGVDIFFVLSGFLITGILLRDNDMPSFWWDFYTRRFFRIVPAFLVVFLIVLMFLPHVSLRIVMTYVFFLANWTIVNGTEIPTMGHIWSLAVEEQFYLIWPVIVRKLPKSQLLYTSLALAISSIVLRLILYKCGINPYVIYKITPTRLDGLAVGSATAIAMQLQRPKEILKQHWINISWAAVAIWLSGFCILKFSYFSWKPMSTVFATPGVEILAGMYIFASLEAELPSKIQVVLVNPALGWLGRRSYGLYLIHEPIHHAASHLLETLKINRPLERFGLNLCSTLSVLVVSLALTEISWRFVESPALRLSKFLTNHGGRIALKQS